MSDELRKIKLIVGLGNPGEKYQETRHNAGFWWLSLLESHYNLFFKTEKRFLGCYAQLDQYQHNVHFLCPYTFMNESGRAVASLSRFHKIDPEEIIVAYDDMELSVGHMKLKSGGGHSGHNGVRNIIQHLGTNSFKRLRIGIGRPELGNDITGYVLTKMRATDKAHTEQNLKKAIEVVADLINGKWLLAVQDLHRFIDEQNK